MDTTISSEYLNYTAIIYKLEHKELINVCYIGQTTDYERRKRQHIIKSRKNNNINDDNLYSLINKYGGIDKFYFKIIVELTCWASDKYYWINLLVPV
jgi:hypothetical protein